MPLTDEALRVVQAANYAAQLHISQRRKGVAAEPYINHLLEVSTLVAEAGADADVVVAALLHDSIEDANVTESSLAQQWGTRVSKLVWEVTDDKSLPKEERKRQQVVKAAKSSPDAQLIKLADKISNLRSIASSPPADWTQQRKVEYHDWAEEVVDGMTAPNTFLLGLFRQVLEEFRGTGKSLHP